MCRLVLLGVHTGSSFQKDIVYILCPQTVRKRMCDQSHEGGTVITLLTSCFSPLASVPWEGRGGLTQWLSKRAGGTSGCSHWFDYSERTNSIVQSHRGNHFWQVRVGPMSLCSKGLSLPLAIPPMPAPACFTFSHSNDSEIWRRRMVPWDQSIGAPFEVVEVDSEQVIRSSGKGCAVV